MRLIKGRSFYKEPWYNSYHSMMDRCYRKNAKNYPFYGGRGIVVCEEWHNIEKFERWAKEIGFQKGLTLERKDVNGNYCPENCTWATKKQQANNRRNTLLIECKGKKHTIGEWSDILGVCQSTISNRYYRGLPIDKVLSKEDLRCQD